MPQSEEGKLVLALMQLQSRIQRRLGSTLSAHGISVTEFMVLRQLSLAPGRTMRRVDLAENVGLSASGVTRLLNPMEKIGLVQKEENARDARVSLVALSEAGQRTLDDASTTFQWFAASVLAPLDAEQKAGLAACLKELL